MSNLTDLIDPEVAERMKALASPITTINGVEVILGSKERFRTTCQGTANFEGCGTPLDVRVTPPGVDPKVLTSRPRVAMCKECAIEMRCFYARGEHGVAITPTTTTEENDMDLSKFSAPQLASLVEQARDRLAAIAEAEVREAALAVQGEREAAETKQVETIAEEREARRGWKLDAFTIHGIDVPALDMSEVPKDLNEVAPATLRSPYNKALHRSGETILGKDACFGEIAAAHSNLLGASKKKPKKAKKAKGAKKVKPEVLVVADLDPTVQAKVDALRSVRPTLTEERARTIVASLA